MYKYNEKHEKNNTTLRTLYVESSTLNLDSVKQSFKSSSLMR